MGAGLVGVVGDAHTQDWPCLGAGLDGRGGMGLAGVVGACLAGHGGSRSRRCGGDEAGRGRGGCRDDGSGRRRRMKKRKK